MRFKKSWWVVLILLLALTFVAILLSKPDYYRNYFEEENENVSANSAYKEAKKERSMAILRRFFYKSPADVKADSVVNFAMNYMGKPYVGAGRDSCGFDCSGFVHFVFKHFGIEVPHQSTLLDTVGQFVPLEGVKKGDILIFTGINSNRRTPGHVGIVVTDNGGVVQFIHSSTYDGVKISQADSTRYEVRYLSARRILK
jgi:cell wall-associated NlpC family hydrolase